VDVPLLQAGTVAISFLHPINICVPREMYAARLKMITLLIEKIENFNLSTF
jgi:hypothetical protein